ncbi:MAG: hypothetical protein O2894_11180 [Planctomycetota bacterium]|nr:hypothetical protein [Planctomycetota bacterium]
MRAFIVVALSLLALGLSSCAQGSAARRDAPGVLELLPGDARAVLEQADRLELLALHPFPFDDGKPAAGEGFHDYKILGRADVPAADRGALVTALYRAIGENDGTAAMCFNPRHGLRAVRGTSTVDLVICFECLQIHGHGVAPDFRSSGLTTQSAEPAFDALLTKLGLTKHVATDR